MSDPLVTVQNVTKTFEHEGRSLEVLKGIDLEVGRGEMVTIVGPSGAGKSTLLHLIGTLDLPTEDKSSTAEGTSRVLEAQNWRSFETEALVLYSNFIICCRSSPRWRT